MFLLLEVALVQERQLSQGKSVKKMVLFIGDLI